MGDVAMRDVAMGDVAMRDVAMRDVAMGDVARRDVAMGDVFERLGFWVGDQRSATRNGGVTRALIKESPNPSAVEGPKSRTSISTRWSLQCVQAMEGMGQC
jgi:hypothetical protein